MSSSRRIIFYLAAILAVLALAGCGTAIEKPAKDVLVQTAVNVLPGAIGGMLGGGSKDNSPTEATLVINVAADVNPAMDGSASPIQVSVYELAGSTGFAKAQFFALRENESATLGADLISREAVMLPPGGARTLELKLDPRTRHLGVTAAFAQIDEAKWKTEVQITPSERNEILVNVYKLSIHSAKK